MPFVDAKCPNCGGEIKLDDNTIKGFCLHCGSQLMVQETIQKFKIEGDVSVQGIASVDNLIKLLYRDIDNGKIRTEDFKERYKRAIELDPDNAELITMQDVLIRNDKVYFVGDSYSGVLEIPEGVVSIEERAFQSCGKLTGVIIPESVTAIGSYAFNYCTQLEKVCLPDSLIEIGESVFSNCKKLREVKFPKRFEYIPSGLFFGCESLEVFNFPNEVKEIGDGAFWKCNTLIEMVVPDTVNKIGKSFCSYCANLISVTLPKTKCEIDYGYQDSFLSGCSNLKNCFNLSFVQDTFGGFKYCEKLRYVSVADGEDHLPKYFNQDIKNIRVLDVPSSIGIVREEEQFWSLDRLKEVIIRGKRKEITIESKAFREGVLITYTDQDSEVASATSIESKIDRSIKSCPECGRVLKYKKGVLVCQNCESGSDMRKETGRGKKQIELKKCSKCGEILKYRKGILVCPSCDSDKCNSSPANIFLEKNFCPNCGATTKRNLNFCTKCGQKMN